MDIIFCLPYAGGSASAYGELKSKAKQRNLELVLIEYAGRASRLDMPLYKNFEDAVDDCYEQIKQYFNRHYVHNYGLFGHSMGSWVVYELMERLQKDPEIENPNKVFLSANTIPQIQIEKKMWSLSDDVFWNELYRQGGLDKELYEVKEFKEYILPIIKNDYRILENYAGDQVRRIIMQSDVCVMGGYKDSITEEEYRMWNQFTNQEFELQWFEGDHFYFRNEGSNIVDYFCRKMKE